MNARQGSGVDSDLHADALFLNPQCNVGRGAERWAAFERSDLAREVGLLDCARFARSGRLEGDLVRRELRTWIRSQLESGARRFVAAGGDGTVHLLLNAMRVVCPQVGVPVDQVVLGAVGLGSSNDFHKPVGHDVHGVPVRLDFANARPVDIGVVDADGESHWFLVAVTLGLTAEGNAAVHRSKGLLSQLKKRWVDGAFLVAGLQGIVRADKVAGAFSADGQALSADRVACLAVVKRPWLGGSMRFDMGTERDDGTLGLHLCGDVSRRRVVQALIGLHTGSFSSCRGTVSRRVTHVEMHLDQPRTIETDGESLTAQHLSVHLLPGHLRVCA